MVLRLLMRSIMSNLVKFLVNLSLWRFSMGREPMSVFFLSFLFPMVMSSASLAKNVPDTLAQRLKACTSCHGAEGRAGSDGYYPRIAGKPQGYLLNQLKNFRDGRRTFPMMNYMVGHMSDDYLDEIAIFSLISIHLMPHRKSLIFLLLYWSVAANWSCMAIDSVKSQHVLHVMEKR